MQLAPLRGPHGLLNVIATPRFLSDSDRAGWGGAFFADLLSAQEGRIDHGHTRYCLQRVLTPFHVRATGATAWQVVPPGVTLWAPGQEQRFDWQGAGRRQFLFVETALAEQLMQRREAQRLLSPAQPLSSPAVDAIFDALVHDLQEGSPAGPLVGESLVTALLLRVDAQGRPAAKGALTRAARDRLLEYIDAHLDAPISLFELSSVAGIGVRHFSRAFKATFADSPHQYLLRQRVERARTLMAGETSLPEVALLCGFSDQSQFTRTFARLAGLTPSAFRAQLHGRKRMS